MSRAERLRERTVAVVTPHRDRYSETFIRAHIERLSARVLTLYGGYYPLYEDDGKALLPAPQRLFNRFAASAASVERHRLDAAVAECYPRSYQDRRLARYLRKKGVDAVLAEYGPTGAEVAEACRGARVPLLVYFHGGDASVDSIVARYGGRYRDVLPGCAAVLAASETQADAVRQFGVPENRIHVLPAGVDTELFQPGKRSLKGPARLLFVGRFVDKKAPHLVLLAFAHASEALDDARLTMVGDGPLLEATKNLAQALEVEDLVTFSGAVSHEEVRDLMCESDIYVQHSLRTSYGDTEGLPVSVLEAAACGLPVVSTRHAGIASAVDHGRTGFLVEPRDVDGMASYMLRLGRDPTMREEFGANARSHVESRFAIQRTLAELEEIIEAAVRRR